MKVKSFDAVFGEAIFLIWQLRNLARPEKEWLASCNTGLNSHLGETSHYAANRVSPLITLASEKHPV